MRLTALVAGGTLALAAMLGAAPARAAPHAQQQAVARARVLGLGRSEAWHRLLLYKRRTGATWASQVDGKDFFFAVRGRVDPPAELEATLSAFFVPVVPGEENAHALCRFPARRQWLESQLHFESELMTVPRCPALDQYTAELDAESVAVVYASNFLDNPASAFGHTFLRVKKRSAPGQSPAVSAPLPSAPAALPAADARDHGIDYTAKTDTGNPLLYAFKGIAGLFPGTFRFRPYDAMLRDYAGYEARDLWEYELALSSSEVKLLIAHVWELANTDIDYLYLTENCSYQIIAALDAAAPRLDLVRRVKADVLPLDTVMAAFETPGLVRSVVYRPSVRSRFRAALKPLPASARRLVDRLGEDPRASLPESLSHAESAHILDAAMLAIDARWSRAIMDERGPAQAALDARRTLEERRDRLVDVEHLVPALAAPLDKRPHRSHGTMRLMLGTGMTTQYGNAFATLGYRVALHDLTDPPDGEPELAQLQFLDTRLRLDYARHELTLDSVTFAELMALNPLSRFEKRLSWRARGLGMRLHDRAAPDTFAHGMNVAVGATVATENEHAVLFLMADAHVLFSTKLDGVAGSLVRVGVGPLAGVRVRLPGRAVGLVTGTWSYLPGQSLQGTFDVRAVLRTQLGQHVAMGLEAAAQPRSFEVQLASYIYF